MMRDPQKDVVIRRMIDLADAIQALFHEDDTVQVITQAVAMALADEVQDYEDLMLIASEVVSGMLSYKRGEKRQAEQHRAQDEADQIAAGTHTAQDEDDDLQNCQEGLTGGNA